MTAPALLIVWSYRRLFVLVTCLTFVVLVGAISILPKQRVTVRSVIEIGVINKRQEPLEVPADLVKRILSVYSPAALVTMAGKGISPSILSSLQRLSVENIGRTVVLVSTVDPNVENEAKEFQGAIFDQTIKQQAPWETALRGDIAQKIDAARAASSNIKQEIDSSVKQLENYSALGDDLRKQIEEQRTYLATLYKSALTPEQPGDRSGVELQIRKLQAQIEGQTALLANLAQERYRLTHGIAEMRQLLDADTRALTGAQLDQNMFSESQVSLPPTVMPAVTSVVTRWLNLLLVALTISVLAGFGMVVLARNIDVRKI